MRGYLFLTVLVLVFSTTVTAYQEPNITEVKDSFGDTYEINNEGYSTKAVSDREIHFGQNKKLEVCVTKVEHEEGAELEFEDFMRGYGPYSLEDRCLSYNLSEDYYGGNIPMRIEVKDTNPSRTFSNEVIVEYNNTVDPLENEGGQETSTEYDYSLIERERKNNLEQSVSELNSTVQEQESEIESLESEISDKDEQIEGLQQELSNLKSGISGTIISIFS